MIPLSSCLDHSHLFKSSQLRLQTLCSSQAILPLCSVSILDPQNHEHNKVPLTFRWFVTQQYITETLGMGLYSSSESFSIHVSGTLDVFRIFPIKCSAFLTFYKAEQPLLWLYSPHELNIAPLFSISYAIFQKFVEILCPLMAPKNLFCIIEYPLLQSIIVNQWLFYSFTNILMDSQKRKDIN